MTPMKKYMPAVVIGGLSLLFAAQAEAATNRAEPYRASLTTCQDTYRDEPSFFGGHNQRDRHVRTTKRCNTQTRNTRNLSQCLALAQTSPLKAHQQTRTQEVACTSPRAQDYTKTCYNQREKGAYQGCVIRKVNERPTPPRHR